MTEHSFALHGVGSRCCRDTDREVPVRALVYLGPGSIVLQERPAPRVGADDDVVVKAVGTGICGTDRKILLGRFPARPGVVLGHESVGLVQEVGAGVRSLQGTAHRGHAADPHARLRDSLGVLPPLRRRGERPHVVLRHVLPQVRRQDLPRQETEAARDPTGRGGRELPGVRPDSGLRADRRPLQRPARGRRTPVPRPARRTTPTTAPPAGCCSCPAPSPPCSPPAPAARERTRGTPQPCRSPDRCPSS
ncbi:alcohol dehydrogenase catalytic domain-containing protein [Streptomyces sp. NPDC015032]|uniref:alcohol dehydrogenase catalytic domain-containing protein n=1 Tax=Streptomyces sp. NPDC015032 TaxID=3364937 RepID=UPI0037000101